MSAISSPLASPAAVQSNLVQDTSLVGSLVIATPSPSTFNPHTSGHAEF